jgi:hypothetical protein
VPASHRRVNLQSVCDPEHCWQAAGSGYWQLRCWGLAWGLAWGYGFGFESAVSDLHSLRGHQAPLVSGGTGGTGGTGCEPPAPATALATAPQSSTGSTIHHDDVFVHCRSGARLNSIARQTPVQIPRARPSVSSAANLILLYLDFRRQFASGSQSALQFRDGGEVTVQ